MLHGAHCYSGRCSRWEWYGQATRVRFPLRVCSWSLEQGSQNEGPTWPVLVAGGCGGGEEGRCGIGGAAPCGIPRHRAGGDLHCGEARAGLSDAARALHLWARDMCCAKRLAPSHHCPRRLDPIQSEGAVVTFIKS